MNRGLIAAAVTISLAANMALVVVAFRYADGATSSESLLLQVVDAMMRPPGMIADLFLSGLPNIFSITIVFLLSVIFYSVPIWVILRLLRWWYVQKSAGS